MEQRVLVIKEWLSCDEILVIIVCWTLNSMDGHLSKWINTLQQLYTISMSVLFYANYPNFSNLSTILASQTPKNV